MQRRLAQRLQNSADDFQEHFKVDRHATEQTEAGPPPTDWASYVQAAKRPARWADGLMLHAAAE
eukprot:4534812-Alexandrium_andersonii.AAC.1